MWNDRLFVYVYEQLYKHWKHWIVISLKFVTPPSKGCVNIIMNITNYQEVNVDLQNTPLWTSKEKKLKTYQLDIQNWKKASYQYMNYYEGGREPSHILA